MINETHTHILSHCLKFEQNKQKEKKFANITEIIAKKKKKIKNSADTKH